MKKTIPLLLILFCFTEICSQQITLSKSCTDTGTPIDLIYPKSILLNQSANIVLNFSDIAESTIFLYVDRVIGNERENQFNKVFRVAKGKTWIEYNFKFTKTGNFEIYFTDVFRNIITSINATVTAPALKREMATTPNFNASIQPEFCEKIQRGNPVNIKKTVSLSKDAGTVYLFIRDSKPLNTEKIILNKWRKKNSSVEYDEYVGSHKYQLDREWTDTFFKLKFTKSGEYKIDIYNEKELLMKTTYITINN